MLIENTKNHNLPQKRILWKRGKIIKKISLLNGKLKRRSPRNYFKRLNPSWQKNRPKNYNPNNDFIMTAPKSSIVRNHPM